VDGTGAALSGRTYLTGWPDRDPVIPGAVPYGDVIVPYAMAAAAAAALQYRRATGQGCHIDAAMYELCVQQTHEAIARAQTGAPLDRMGNQEPGMYHQGVYRTVGSDRWIAISCQARGDWQRLLAHAALPPTLEPADGDVPLDGWCASQDGMVLQDRLQAAGFCAGLVQDIEDLLEHDPQIASRNSLMALTHPLLGTFGHIRTPISFSDSNISPFRAPSLGEHSRAIASEIAGLSAERVEALETLGVFR
jgi:crotonobetainyl-CoA:carnitine CoA-transferase CaiB-like acyl-CoA transferase